MHKKFNLKPKRKELSREFPELIDKKTKKRYRWVDNGQKKPPVETEGV
jgi:hypothetical protein